jgi:hypothetical protein
MKIGDLMLAMPKRIKGGPRPWFTYRWARRQVARIRYRSQKKCA